jgi:thiol-disulfide isomerase/thioredoxin/YHS domain-containing protein
MRRIATFFLASLALLASSGAAIAQDAHFWQPTLDTAKRTAAQTGRLVLVYFHADWCQACQAMEQQVFAQPAVAADIQTYFVPVRVHADHFPATARQYGVTALPTLVAMTPSGQALDAIQGRLEAGPLVARLNQVALAARRQQPQPGVASLAGSGPPDPRGHATAAPGPDHRTWAASPPAASPPAVPQPPPFPHGTPSPSPYASAPPPPYRLLPTLIDEGRAAPPASATWPTAPPTSPNPSAPPPAAPPSWAMPFAGPPPGAPPTAAASPPGAWTSPGGSMPPEAGIAPQNPPLGLDGYCPVTLAEKKLWVVGDRAWGAIHRGRTYLFAGPDEQRRFLQGDNPDRYAPVLGGHDVVRAVEQGQMIPGHRRHGLFFGGQIYLFADEAALETFSRNAHHYADRALQATASRPVQNWMQR